LKAKITIGNMSVELQGEPQEVSISISRLADWPETAGRQIRTQRQAANPKKSTGGRRGLELIKTDSPPPKKKQGRPPIKPWSAADNKKFIQLYDEKKTVKEMAEMLKRSEGSIYQRIIHLRNKGDLK
jgi:hypothetical protein